MDGRPTWTDCDEAGDYVVPNVLSPRDLVSRSDNMDETVPHIHAFPRSFVCLSVCLSVRACVHACMLPSFFPSLLPSVIACVHVHPSFVHSSVLPSICPSMHVCVNLSFHPSVHPFFLPSFLSSFLPFHSSKLTKNLQSLYKRIGLRKFHCCFICGAESLNMIFRPIGDQNDHVHIYNLYIVVKSRKQRQ